jgi:ABC-type transport system substrate-binding protein
VTAVRRHRPAPIVAALAVAMLAGGACGDQTPSPSPSAAALASPTATPVPSERAFAPVAWPETGSACDVAGYKGLLGRIEATGPRTVRFTLCAPDGAFPTRLAHPSLGVLDTVVAERVEGDPASVRDVAGAGPFRIVAWTADNIRLERAGPGGAAGGAGSPGASGGAGSPAPSASGPAGPVPTIVLRWDPAAGSRTDALQAADVDGIDAPSADDLDTISTIPELAVLPRPGLATAYLGLGTGFQLDRIGVRRAFAQGIDRSALASGAFGPGALAADFLAPCEVTGGCAGTAWYDTNGPAGSALLDDAGFDRRTAIPLHVPDGAVPGLEDPAGVGAAVAAQLTDSLGVKVRVDTMAAADLQQAVTTRKLQGLYLAGVASPLADAAGFLGPLFARGGQSATAVRGKDVTRALARAAAVTDPAARAVALGRANDQVRSDVPLVPLVHPGALTAWRADVAGAAVSPIGADPLGSVVPGDRGQVVMMGAVEPEAAWCGMTEAVDAVRLCALVTPGLYGFDGAALDAVPDLAAGCAPDDDARAWTCRLRAATFADGAQLDAGDVVATFRAVGDAGGPLRAALPPGAFAAWDGLFGGPLPASP